ncbi:hypothetical protein DFH07DRAFT_1034712 [Mycena maculata]|uniref:Nucleolar protein 12 n=1 Tax=Mycena maculata TaxID=230809 RepID=A0AAD7N8T0_9AGAR|nr:hypothetical protein DFH07DRAFT_1034712 [Mycena maculata]
MSLSSLLLASGPKKIDKELDALFKTNVPVPPRKPATPINVPTPGSAPGSAPPAKKKRKLDTVDATPSVPSVSSGERKTKRIKSEKATLKTSPKPTKIGKPSPKIAKVAKPGKKSKRADAQSESEDDTEEDEDNSDLENAYLGKQRPAAKGAAPPAESDAESDGNSEEASGANSEEDEEEPDADSDPDAPPPVHESLTKRARAKPTKKAKVVPEGETPAQRDARTLFVGGLPIEIVQKKPIQKRLSRHLLSFLPSGSRVKIESTRFRSVAFRDPTSSTALSASASPTTTPGANAKLSANTVPIPGANHASARASTWRQSGAADAKGKSEAEDEGAGGEKQYLTPAQKKKILFIQGAIHPEARGVNAYVVLAHHSGDADEDTPAAAAAHIARTANASVFVERTLRVDVCAPGAGAGADGEAGMGGAAGDPKLSIFVGNLDFGAREDDVRTFFEGVLAGERGPAPAPPDAMSDEGEDDGAGGRWVLGVRLVRDRETQLGKGFGYVRFVDRECVDEILALAKTDEGRAKLKFAKRTLRAQRCRVIGAAKPAASASASAKDPKSKSKSSYPPAPPKRGDPTLGARLAHLDKDARKAAKKADAARIDRRAEKKKMGARVRVDKVKAATGGAKRVGGWKGDKGKGKGTGKERERERKARVSKHGGSKGGK